MTHVVERATQILLHAGATQIRREQAVRSQVVHVLRDGQLLEELHHVRGPACHVASELFQHARRPLAPSIRDGVRHLSARAADLRHHTVQAPMADEIAEIGHDPVGTRLDELVVVELFEVLFEHQRLAGNHVQQLAQRPARLRITHPVYDRQQAVQPLCVEAHVIASSLASGAGSSINSSADCTCPSAPSAGMAAGKRGLTTCVFEGGAVR